MFDIPIFQVDAFSEKAFGGNPAAVCPMPFMLAESSLQAIAAENNLSETAFLLPLEGDDDADYLLRWFTPTLEVDLCGHATLASAYVIFNHLQPDLEQVRFSTRSGILSVKRNGDRYSMDFPKLSAKPIDMPVGIGAAMGAEPTIVCKSESADRDLLLVYPDTATVQGLVPNDQALKAFAPFGFIATAPGNVDTDVDFVSRCFFPNHGINEDPVTGSAHCVSAPYWAKVLGKDELFAQQISARGGDLWLRVGAERVEISGHANEVMRGTFTVPE